MIVGFTAGTFDLCHAGHLMLLKEAKEKCDYLVVGLHTDPSKERDWKSSPTETVLERYIRLKSCLFVDEIVPYDTENDLVALLMFTNPDIRFVGDDYNAEEVERITGYDKCTNVAYVDRSHNFSSTKLKTRIKHEKQSITSWEKEAIFKG